MRRCAGTWFSCLSGAAAATRKHADETINRVIRKIDEGEEVRDVIAMRTAWPGVCCWKRFSKSRKREQIGIDELPPLVAQPAEQDEMKPASCAYGAVSTGCPKRAAS